MSEMVQIILYGSLRNTGIDSPNSSNKLLAVGEATPLKNVIHQLDIQIDKVQLAMRNHRAVSKDANIKPGDRLALFPVEYPIYPDWIDFRF
jgi:hypothetical protein